MVMFSWKTKNVPTLNFLLIKDIGKDFSDLKISISKDLCSSNYGPLNVELAIWFYWFLNKSLWLNADENNTKVPISKTNFNNKVPISKIYYKNVTLPENMKLLCPVTVNWQPFHFSVKFLKNHKYQVNIW